MSNEHGIKVSSGVVVTTLNRNLAYFHGPEGRGWNRTPIVVVEVGAPSYVRKPRTPESYRGTSLTRPET